MHACIKKSGDKRGSVAHLHELGKVAPNEAAGTSNADLHFFLQPKASAEMRPCTTPDRDTEGQLEPAAPAEPCFAARRGRHLNGMGVGQRERKKLDRVLLFLGARVPVAAPSARSRHSHRPPFDVTTCGPPVVRRDHLRGRAGDAECAASVIGQNHFDGLRGRFRVRTRRRRRGASWDQVPGQWADHGSAERTPSDPGSLFLAQW